MAKTPNPDDVFWYKRKPSVALSGMRGLSPEEKGVYTVIIDLCYEHRGPLADDDVQMARNCDCSLRKYRGIKAALLAKDRIQVDREAGTIFDERAVRELVRAELYSETQARRAGKRWRKKGEVVPLRVVCGKPEVCPDDMPDDPPLMGHMKGPNLESKSNKIKGPPHASRVEKNIREKAAPKSPPPTPAQRQEKLENFRRTVEAEAAQEGKDDGSDGGSGATIGDGKAARRKRLPGVGN